MAEFILPIGIVLVVLCLFWPVCRDIGNGMADVEAGKAAAIWHNPLNGKITVYGSQDVTVSVATCEGCGKALDQDARYCTRCGAARATQVLRPEVEG